MSPRDTPDSRARHNATYRAKHREKINENMRLYRRNLKQQALDHYGLVCRHCGYSDWRALQIDHINDNGAAERKSLGGKNFSGHNFYSWLKKQGWPSGYQTLCANCNLIKHLGDNF